MTGKGILIPSSDPAAIWEFNRRVSYQPLQCNYFLNIHLLFTNNNFLKCPDKKRLPPLPNLSPHHHICESLNMPLWTHPKTHPQTLPCPITHFYPEASDIISASLTQISKSICFFWFCFPSFIQHQPLAPSVPGHCTSSSLSKTLVICWGINTGPKSAEWKCFQSRERALKSYETSGFLILSSNYVFLWPWARHVCLSYVCLCFSHAWDKDSLIQPYEIAIKTHKARDSTSDLLSCLVYCCIPCPGHNTQHRTQGTEWWSRGPEPDTQTQILALSPLSWVISDNLINLSPGISFLIFKTGTRPRLN